MKNIIPNLKKHKLLVIAFLILISTTSLIFYFAIKTTNVNKEPTAIDTSESLVEQAPKEEQNEESIKKEDLDSGYKVKKGANGQNQNKQINTNNTKNTSHEKASDVKPKPRKPVKQVPQNKPVTPPAANPQAPKPEHKPQKVWEKVVVGYCDTVIGDDINESYEQAEKCFRKYLNTPNWNGVGYFPGWLYDMKVNNISYCIDVNTNIVYCEVEKWV